MDDAAAMRLALDEVRRAMAYGDVPVGAVVVRDSEVIAAACNERELRNDPTAHAEVIALRAAAKRVGSWRLTDCTLYVTLEPCTMCAGAIINSRVGTVVFGAGAVIVDATVQGMGRGPGNVRTEYVVMELTRR
ncbi:MAG: tRNA-specific adenosine deaminase, partial [Actinobacteria bacterium]|nr:tRNA-specific adenosine deaminase [Actinomycetota bacterium]